MSEVSKKPMSKSQIIAWMKDAYVMIGEKNNEGKDEGKCLLGALIDILKEEEANANYVWLNINDGSFSNSWSEAVHQKVMDDEIIEAGNRAGCKLIKYECLNDDKFQFYNLMEVRTKSK